MPTDWTPASAAPPPVTAISKAARARAGVPTWSAPPWPLRQPFTATSSTCAVSPDTPKDTAMKTFVTTAALLALCALTGCNTVKGIGQDLQKAGEKIEDVAKKK